MNHRLALIILLVILASCKELDYSNIPSHGRAPSIEPDYSGVTIPPNIAPMNFKIIEDVESFAILAGTSDKNMMELKSRDGIVSFPLKAWKKMMDGSSGDSIKIRIISKDKKGELREFDPVIMHVANETIDPYICYRLLYPGYQSWVELSIVQRSIEDFYETSVFENQLLDNNCVNCHSFNNNDPEKFMLHVRGSLGGTYLVDGDNILKTALKTDSMPANAVYPSWHPDGRYIAFSSNRTVQSFHMRPEKNIEVYDLFSTLVIYDVEKNEIFGCPDNDTTKYMETFPFWSACGNYLYYCRTNQVERDHDYRTVKYDLIRKSFNKETGKTGEPEMVFNAGKIDKSVSLPVASPDGKFLVFTLHDYGTFSIWHKEADLYIMDLSNRSVERMSLNSDNTESWHGWSSNSRWLVFSSKRLDGLTARPHFAYVDSSGQSQKPFVLPQEDPTFYDRFEKTFNRPELIKGRIKAGPRDFARASGNEPLKAKWTERGK